MKRPLSLTIVALLYLIVGLLAAWEFAKDILDGGNLFLNFGFIGIFAGIGLLRPRPYGRFFAFLMLWFCLLLVGALAIATLVAPEMVTFRWGGHVSNATQDPGRTFL